MTQAELGYITAGMSWEARYNDQIEFRVELKSDQKRKLTDKVHYFWRGARALELSEPRLPAMFCSCVSRLLRS